MTTVRFYTLLFLLITASCFAQALQSDGTCIMDQRRSRYYGYNLSDNVKSVRWFYTHIKEGITNQERQRITLKNDVRPNFYTEFGRNGLEVKQIMFSKDYRDMPLDSGKIDVFLYDKDDLKLKINCHNKIKQPFVVYNHSLYPNVNYNLNSSFYKNTHQNFYKNTYDENGRLIQEIGFFSATRSTDTLITAEILTDENITHIKDFVYDLQNNIILQKITRGRASEGLNYSDFGTEASYCKDLQITYDYDDSNRIIKITLSNACEGIVFQESYTYHPQKGYVTLASTIFNSYHGYTSSRMTSHYNEHGDILERNFIAKPVPGRPPQKTPLMIGNTPMNHYYEYDYDKHGNWIKCRYYLDGTKDGEPSAISERVIEYFD